MSTMDDTRTLSATFAGKKIKAAPISEGQMVALTMIKTGGSSHLPLKILMSVIESSVGPETWSDMVTSLASGEVTLSDFTKTLERITKATVAARQKDAEIAPELIHGDSA